MCKCVLLLAFVLLLTGGCGGDKPKFTEEELALIPLAQREGLPECSGGFVLAVGGETVTSDEIILPVMEHFKPIAQRTELERFKERARGELEKILMTKISNILLYQEAKKQAGEDVEERLEKLVETEVRRFIAGFEGDSARAEEALEQMGMDWRSFKEYQRKRILSQSYIASQMPENRPITYSELLDCYNRMKNEFFVRPAMIKFRLIDIRPEKLEIKNPNENRQEQAKLLANELVRQIQEGRDFGELARQYSHGHRALFGGLWKLVQPGSLAEPYDVLAAEAEKIKPRQIAGPIEAGGHFFIMKLVERQAKSFKPLEEVQREVEARIVFDRRKQTVDELEAKLVQQAALGQKNEFIDFCLEKIYRASNR